MRYINQPTIIFEDQNGIQYPIKDNLLVKTYKTVAIVNVDHDIFLDELISRNDFYGDGSESLSYAVVDNNIIPILENNFDLSKLKKIKIPFIEG